MEKQNRQTVVSDYIYNNYVQFNRLGMLLQQAGFASKRVGKTRTRGWLVRERGLDEVNANRNINANG